MSRLLIVCLGFILLTACKGIDLDTAYVPEQQEQQLESLRADFKNNRQDLDLLKSYLDSHDQTRESFSRLSFRQLIQKAKQQKEDTAKQQQERQNLQLARLDELDLGTVEKALISDWKLLQAYSSDPRANRIENRILDVLKAKNSQLTKFSFYDMKRCFESDLTQAEFAGQSLIQRGQVCTVAFLKPRELPKPSQAPVIAVRNLSEPEDSVVDEVEEFEDDEVEEDEDQVNSTQQNVNITIIRKTKRPAYHKTAKDRSSTQTKSSSRSQSSKTGSKSSGSSRSSGTTSGGSSKRR